MLFSRHTRRREFIALVGGVAGWPRVGRAQQHSWVKIGYLSGRSLEPELPILTPFRNGLAEAGHVEGRNASIEFRFAQGHDHLLPMLAKELVDDQVRVLVGTDRPSAVALKKATTSIPIVFASGVNPIDAGLVGSINRPDGNATGVNLFTSELGPKRLEILRELIPNATVIAFLVNPHDASTAFQLQHIQIAAETVGQRLRIIHVTTEAEIDPAFETAARERVSAVMYSANRLFQVVRERAVSLAAQHSIPAMYEWPEFVKSGGLSSYSADRAEMYRQVAVYTGLILNGAKISDLPIVQPTKFQLVMNSRTAKALNLTIPPALLARADEVIE